MIHKVKLLLAKIRWSLNNLYFAMLHSKEVGNYEFLVGLKNDAHDKYLELERANPDNPDLVKLKIQIELIDKIINYVK